MGLFYMTGAHANACISLGQGFETHGRTEQNGTSAMLSKSSEVAPRAGGVLAELDPRTQFVSLWNFRMQLCLEIGALQI